MALVHFRTLVTLRRVRVRVRVGLELRLGLVRVRIRVRVRVNEVRKWTTPAKYSDFGPIPRLYLRNGARYEHKLVLITNRKSYMSFRLVPKSVTLNDLERRRPNRPNGCLISPNSVACWADCVKVVEDRRILCAAEM